jgi:DNA polymerase-3 subunit gamma/tau
MDVIEIDAASNRGVDEIRDLRDKVKYAPTEVRYKVYIIDEVHMLTTEAFNALLKTLEEPPSHVIFILATTEPHKLLPTIVSRCQRFAFRRLSLETIIGRLKLICDSGQISYDERALELIARAADGGMRDALSLLDQVLAFGKDKLDEDTVVLVTGSVSRKELFGLIYSLYKREVPSAFQQLHRFLQEGVEPEKLLQDLTFVCRDLLLLKTAPALFEAERSNEEQQLAKEISTTWLNQLLEKCIFYQQKIKWVSHPRILLEMFLVQICEQLKEEPRSSEYESRIQALEREIEKLKSRISTAAVSAPPQKQEEKPKSQLAPTPKSTSIRSDWIKRLSPEMFQKVKRVWPEVLNRVKAEKITVHAWLVDGEPVAATEDLVLIAFRGPVHRDAVEKENNRNMIEAALSQVLGSPMRIKAIMRSDWEEWKQQVNARLEREEENVPEEDSVDPVKRAIDLFGADLVEVIE